MFTPAERERIRASLVDAALADARISGITLTGSASVDREDPWRDIDLAFGVRDASALPRVLDDFTRLMTREHGALDTVDVTTGVWVYRVFLLASTLQVDLAFAPAAEFGARAPTFRLVHGEAATLPPRLAPAAHPLIGSGWPYALHARSAIARGKPWQAEFMISAMRDQTLALASLRHAPTPRAAAWTASRPTSPVRSRAPSCGASTAPSSSARSPSRWTRSSLRPRTVTRRSRTAFATRSTS